MRYLIFSDMHLSATNFDPKLANTLTTLIQASDRVIILGDFFDAYLNTFEDFRQSKWSKLFPYLLKKKAVYVYGNHDRPEYMNESVTEFSVEQTYRKVLRVKGVPIVLQHGHLYAPDFDGTFPTLSYYLSWLYPRYHYHTTNATWLHHLFLKAYNENKNKFLHTELKLSLKRMLSKNPQMRSSWQVTGHSHIQDVDYPLRYINIGTLTAGSLQYALLDTHGTIQVVKDSYVQTVAVV